MLANNPNSPNLLKCDCARPGVVESAALLAGDGLAAHPEQRKPGDVGLDSAIQVLSLSVASISLFSRSLAFNVGGMQTQGPAAHLDDDDRRVSWCTPGRCFLNSCRR